MKIVRFANCGNSPKSLLAEDLLILLIKKDFKKLSGYLSPDFVFRSTPQSELPAEEMEEFLRDFHHARSAKIEFVISHGKHAAVQFILNGNDPSHFCLTMEAVSPAFKKLRQMNLFRMC